MHGNGTMRLKNGQAYSGVWENGINTRINEWLIDWFRLLNHLS